MEVLRHSAKDKAKAPEIYNVISPGPLTLSFRK